MGKVAPFFLLLLISCTSVQDDNHPVDISPMDDSLEDIPIAENDEALSWEEGESDELYHEHAVLKQAKRSFIPEVDFLEETLKILIRKDWDGVSQIPISPSDYDDEYLEKLIQENAYQEDYIIPDDYAILLIDEKDDVEQVIRSAHEEYLSFIQAKDVADRYIARLQDVLPPERIEYHAVNVEDVPLTAVTPAERLVHSRLRLDIYAFDIYNRMEKLEKAGLSRDRRILRDASVRMLIYHEMTHALQRAYDVENAWDHPDSMAAWIYTDKKLYLADISFHHDWGRDYATESNNRQISTESQAEGVSYEALLFHYKLAPAQKLIVKDALYDYLEDARISYDWSMEAFEEHFPEVNIDGFGSQLWKDSFYKVGIGGEEPVRTLSDLSLKLGNLPAYGGYFHPMEETEKFWDYLR